MAASSASLDYVKFQLQIELAATAAFIGSCPKDCSLAAARMELDTKEAGLAVDLFWSWKVRVVCGGCGSSRLLGEFSYSDAERHLQVPFKTMQVVLQAPWRCLLRAMGAKYCKIHM